MKRLTVSVDDVAALRYGLNDSDFDPVQYAILCEVAGANGISLTLTNSEYGIQERDAQLLKKLYKTFLNIHLPPDPQVIKAALSLNPDMVTFAEVARGETVKLSPLSHTAFSEILPGVLPDFRANNISVAALCYPEINVLKQLSKIRIDYVEFDCTEITTASDSNEELVGFDKLSTATLAAAKLGIGVNCFGGIDYGYLATLAVIPRLEDICLGRSILKRAMLVGVERAVREAREQILFHQRG